MPRYLVTAESVTEGHPDKVADAVSDSVLDAIVGKDPAAHVDVETLIMQGMVVVTGQITTKAYVNIPSVVRGVLRDIGLDNAKDGLDWATCGVISSIEEQSPDIALGVDEKKGLDMGAGDQGFVFGYACKETKELMPLPTMLAHKLVMRLTECRKNGTLPYLRPDGKSQVTVEYVDGVPKRVDTVVIAAQHSNGSSIEKVRSDIKKEVIEKTIPKGMLDGRTKLIINGTGKFTIGGTLADSGLTGRKTVVDGYGSTGKSGGGCFCVVGSALVNTQDGIDMISDLENVGGKLVKTDISPTPAGGWYCNGELSTLRVRTEDGYELEGTHNQSIRVVDQKGNYVWRRLDELNPTDWIAIQRKNRLFGMKSLNGKFDFKHKAGTSRKNAFSFPEELTEDYAYLLGLLIGDGNCKSRDGIWICACEKGMGDIIQGLYRRLFGRYGKMFGHWAFYGGAELRAYLEHLGLGKVRSYDKEVPTSVFHAPKPVMAAFIRGLFDIDGSVLRIGRNRKSVHIKMSSTSQKLVQQVQMLLLNFGIITHIQKIENVGKASVIRGHRVISKRPLYDLGVKGTESARIFSRDIGFGLTRKAEKLESLVSEDKRDFTKIPSQQKRVERLWSRLPHNVRVADACKIGRFTRGHNGKATKELTYEKLKEFLDTYASILEGNYDFEYLRTLYLMNNYYTRMKSIEPSKAEVYDLTVPGAHTFTANGFVCHNSGKDPTKVDRSGAYYARYIAKNIVAAGLAEKCEVQIAYAIGVARPVSFYVNTLGTGKISDDRLAELVKKHFDMRPGAMIRELELRRPIFRKTSAYGHFGREEPEFKWERTDKAAMLKKEAARPRP